MGTEQLRQDKLCFIAKTLCFVCGCDVAWWELGRIRGQLPELAGELSVCQLEWSLAFSIVSRFQSWLDTLNE